MSNANERQVGGDHYRSGGAASGDQHWDRQWRLHGRGYFIGQITRYVERYHLKNGLEDLAKAQHYIEKLKELEQAWIDGTGPPPGEAGAAKLPGIAYAGDAPKLPECPPEACAVRDAAKAHCEAMRAAGVITIHPTHEYLPNGLCRKCGFNDLSARAMEPCDPSALASKAEPCCGCGADYPRADLLAGHMYCQACRRVRELSGLS